MQEKSDFLVNGELFFLELLSHREPQLRNGKLRDLEQICPSKG